MDLGRSLAGVFVTNFRPATRSERQSSKQEFEAWSTNGIRGGRAEVKEEATRTTEDSMLHGRGLGRACPLTEVVVHDIAQRYSVADLIFSRQSECGPPRGMSSDVSPFSHPGPSRICFSFEPCRLGGAMGWGAKPPSERSDPPRCIAGSLTLA